MSSSLWLTGAVLVVVTAAGAGKPAPALPRPQAAAPVAQAAPAPLMATLQQELEREMVTLSKADPPAYFMSYTVTESNRASVSGSNGALLSSNQSRGRWLEAQVRVGSYELDNTRRVAGGGGGGGGYGQPIPVEDDAGVLRRAMWRQTENQYRAAAEALIKIQTSRDVQVQTAEGGAPDFSREKANVSYRPMATLSLDRRPWEEKTRVFTRFFRNSPAILNSIVTFSAQATNQYQVNSEGTKLQFGQLHYRLELFIQGKAADGMDINRYYNFDWTDPAAAPDDAHGAGAGCDIAKRDGRTGEGAAGGAFRRAGHADRPCCRGLLP